MLRYKIGFILVSVLLAVVAGTSFAQRCGLPGIPACPTPTPGRIIRPTSVPVEPPTQIPDTPSAPTNPEPMPPIQPTATRLPLPVLPFEGDCVLATTGRDRVNVRSIPGLDGIVRGQLNPFEVYPVHLQLDTGADDHWYLTTLGWVSANVVRLGGNCGLLPALHGDNPTQLALNTPNIKIQLQPDGLLLWGGFLPDDSIVGANPPDDSIVGANPPDDNLPQYKMLRLRMTCDELSEPVMFDPADSAISTSEDRQMLDDCLLLHNLEVLLETVNGADETPAQFGIVVPGSLVGFNPQPEPPAKLVEQCAEITGITTGLEEVGFNPQPEPPAIPLNCVFLLPTFPAFNLPGLLSDDSRVKVYLGIEDEPDNDTPPLPAVEIGYAPLPDHIQLTAIQDGTSNTVLVGELNKVLYLCIVEEEDDDPMSGYFSNPLEDYGQYFDFPESEDTPDIDCLQLTGAVESLISSSPSRLDETVSAILADDFATLFEPVPEPERLGMCEESVLDKRFKITEGPQKPIELIGLIQAGMWIRFRMTYMLVPEDATIELLLYNTSPYRPPPLDTTTHVSFISIRPRFGQGGSGVHHVEIPPADFRMGSDVPVQEPARLLFELDESGIYGIYAGSMHHNPLATDFEIIARCYEPERMTDA